MKNIFTDQKFGKLYTQMEQEDIDCVLIGPSGDMQYLIGFNPGGCERFQGLFLHRDGRHFYVSNVLYHEDMAKVLGKDCPFYLWHDNDGWLSAVTKAFEDFSLNNSRIAVSDSIRGVDLLDMQVKVNAQFITGTELLQNYRAVKNWDNIEDMRTAARFADEVMESLTAYIRPGITEKDIQEKIVTLFAEKGAPLSFTPIVASGANNSRPHYVDNSRIIKEKDVIILDLGCRVNGYCSDTSRTFFVGGVTEEEEKIYTIVCNAYMAARQHVKEGVTAGEVDKKARDVIEQAGYGKYFLNRTGHGIGCDVHEAPYIVGNSSQMLEKGMAFSIEPGIYLPGKVGMRVEDIVIVNEQGEGESLNKFTKELTVL